MMLLERNFYTVKEKNIDEGKLNVLLQINAGNEIFKGHFPEMPIVPGVCMLQMVRELVEEQLGSSVAIAEIVNMKFIAAYNPLEHETSMMEISYASHEKGYKIVASLKNEAVVFFKLNAIFK